MTTETALATREQPALTPFQVIERVITQGDLAKMSAEERIAFYWRTCESLGLNPLTRPFEFISLNGKLTMYARKDATDQLRKKNRVSVTGIQRAKDDELGLITVTARVKAGDGREDESTGVVNIKGLSGEALANALMKAETKAKRRATLSLVGLGFLDESEVEGAERVDVDPTTGAITERPKPKSLLEHVQAEQAKLAGEADAAAVATEVEGDGAWLEDAIAAAPEAEVEQSPAEPAELDLADTLRKVAEDVGIGRPATKDELAAVGAVFAGWDERMVKAGIRIAFGSDAIASWTAGRAKAITLVADSLGDRFAPAWGAMVSAAAS